MDAKSEAQCSEGEEPALPLHELASREGISQAEKTLKLTSGLWQASHQSATKDVICKGLSERKTKDLGLGW